MESLLADEEVGLMPFTPFHLGLGVLLKGLAPRAFSWTAFAATQVVIDVETLYYLVRREYPVHRALHTSAGAALAGVATALALLAVARAARSTMPAVWTAVIGRRHHLRTEWLPAGVLAGGLVGGVSHAWLDAIMHRDVRPLMPWTPDNPLLGAVGLATLHLGCVLAALVGAAILWWRGSATQGAVTLR